MKYLPIITVVLLCPMLALSQARYRTNEGHINFNASTPLEDIDANNKRVNAIIDGDSGEFAAVLLIKDFQFPRKLMQEHFNENFMESSTYPKAQFRGRLLGFSASALSNNTMPLRITGDMTIHGVTRQVDVLAEVNKSGETIHIHSEFILAPEDYEIEVPTLLFNKIAREVKVWVSLELSPDTPPQR